MLIIKDIVVFGCHINKGLFISYGGDIHGVGTIIMRAKDEITGAELWSLINCNIYTKTPYQFLEEVKKLNK